MHFQQKNARYFMHFQQAPISSYLPGSTDIERFVAPLELTPTKNSPCTAIKRKNYLTCPLPHLPHTGRNIGPGHINTRHGISTSSYFYEYQRHTTTTVPPSQPSDETHTHTHTYRAQCIPNIKSTSNGVINRPRTDESIESFQRSTHPLTVPLATNVEQNHLLLYNQRPVTNAATVQSLHRLHLTR